MSPGPSMAPGTPVAAPRASSVALLAESAPPFWLQGFKTDVQQSICDLRVSLATESRAQHEELKRHLDDNLRTMQIQTDAKFAALETRLEALERDYHRRPDPESPRSVGTPTSGSPSGGQGLARGVFDPSDSTFEMVVGGFDQDKRVDIATSLQILYEDEELKEIVASHRCDFRDNKALISLKFALGDGFPTMRKKQRAFIARWRQLKPLSLAGNRRGQSLWASQLRAPPAVRSAASSAWARRWWAMLAVSVQQAVTSTALGSAWPAPLHASRQSAPELERVLDLADAAGPSRLPLRGP